MLTSLEFVLIRKIPPKMASDFAIPKLFRDKLSPPLPVQERLNVSSDSTVALTNTSHSLSGPWFAPFENGELVWNKRMLDTFYRSISEA